MANEIVGSVAELWRFPVKSMKGEQVEDVQITATGFLGDRGYALIESATGKVVSAKSVKLFPDLLGCRAAFVESPQLGRQLPPVRIDLPDGSSVTSDAKDAAGSLSAYFRRDVTLARAAPVDFTIDQYHPDLEDLDPAGHRNEVMEQKLGSAFFAEAGLDSPVPEGLFFDLFPLTILTTSTLAEFSKVRPETRFDRRRFRMNVIINTTDVGFVENSWVGRALSIGDTLRIRVAIPDPRCVMTTLAQDELPKDNEVLRTLARYNRLQVGDSGRFPCAGVYAVIEVPGVIRRGDRVTIQ
jgi:uncharacterized protein YcbX